jgi:hypothetical protein
MKKSLTLTLALLTGGILASTVEARYIDTLDTTDNLFGAFGGLTASASSGEVTLTKTASGDAGINWQEGGGSGSAFSLSTASDEHVLALSPVTPVNGGFYSVQILFFNGPTFVSENTLIPDTNSILPTTNNIAGFAQSLNITATDWFPRIRLLPFGASDSAFTFTEIAAIPEPNVMALAAFVALAFARRRG